jgi:hypothetical protein
LLVLFLLAAGCAIAPRGPKVSHTVEDFTGRSDGLVHREVWKDDAFGHGIYVFTDPALANVKVWHTNQAALGGCSHFQAGSLTIMVDSNTAPIIGAVGTATGNILGAAAKAAVK